MAEGQASPDLATAKRLQQNVWSEGDFGIVAHLVQLVAEELVEVVDVMPGERVLDVACGTGNVALAAESLDIDFREGDAEALPVEDARPVLEVVATRA